MIKIASVQTDRVLQLCNSIRQLKSLPLRERVEAVNELLKSIDAVRIATDPDLLCINHAKQLRECEQSTIYRSAQNGRLAIYRVCCRDFFSRTEIEQLPIKKASGGWNRGLPQSVTHRRKKSHASECDDAMDGQQSGQR